MCSGSCRSCERPGVQAVGKRRELGRVGEAGGGGTCQSRADTPCVTHDPFFCKGKAKAPLAKRWRLAALATPTFLPAARNLTRDVGGPVGEGREFYSGCSRTPWKVWSERGTVRFSFHKSSLVIGKGCGGIAAGGLSLGGHCRGRVSPGRGLWKDADLSVLEEVSPPLGAAGGDPGNPTHGRVACKFVGGFRQGFRLIQRHLGLFPNARCCHLEDGLPW